MCRSNISCACLGRNFGWGAEGLSLVCWTCSLSVLTDGLCARVSHDVLPLAALNPFKALLSFSGKGKAFKRPFPALLLQKDNFFQKQKDSTSLTWGIQLMCQGTSNAWQLLKIYLCLHCWLWAVDLPRAAVLALLGMQAGHSQKVNRTSSHLEKGWGGVAIYSFTDLSIICWSDLIRREKNFTRLFVCFFLICSPIEIQDNHQRFHQWANDSGEKS